MDTETNVVTFTSNSEKSEEADRQKRLQTDRDGGIKSQLMSFCWALQ